VGATYCPNSGLRSPNRAARQLPRRRRASSEREIDGMPTTRHANLTRRSAPYFCSFLNAREGVVNEGAPVFGLRKESFTMPKGQEKSKTTNKPKLTVKEKKAKKKEKAASK
jgi:hypothetical protein